MCAFTGTEFAQLIPMPYAARGHAVVCLESCHTVHTCAKKSESGQMMQAPAESPVSCSLTALAAILWLNTCCAHLQHTTDGTISIPHSLIRLVIFTVKAMFYLCRTQEPSALHQCFLGMITSKKRKCIAGIDSGLGCVIRGVLFLGFTFFTYMRMSRLERN